MAAMTLAGAPGVPARPVLALGLILISMLVRMIGCHDPSRPPDIVLISVDTLRPDHMSLYGYPYATTPELDRFFADAAVFERAYATSSFTTASMVSALTGLLPQEHGVRLFDQLIPESTTLVSELLPEAYQSAAFVSNGVLSDRGLGIADRFDHFDDSMERREDTRRLERDAVATTNAALDWLREERDPERPLFLWVHYMDPHEPYAAPDAGEIEVRPGATAPEPVVYRPEEHPGVDALERIAAYDAEIRYTDREIGRLLRGLEAADRRDDTLWIFTADHGESLAERKRWFVHAENVFEEQVLVPLLLRGPGVQGGRRSHLVSGVDLAPTLLRVAGVPARNLDGHDLREASPASRQISVESVHNFDGTQVRALIDPQGKWVVRLRGSGPQVVERSYWDLDRDPAEERPLPWPAGAEAGAALLGLIERDPDAAGKPTDFRQGVLTRENADLLRELGYLE